MLILLKPWHDITTNLKSNVETWASTFEEFRVSAPQKVHRILSGIQYFHECESAAQAEGSQLHAPTIPTDRDLNDESGIDHIPAAQGFSEEGLAILKAEAVSLREELHRRMAVEIAKHVGIFRNDQRAWSIKQENTPTNAKDTDLSRISMWSGLLQAAADGTHGTRGSDPPPTTATTATIELSLLSDDSPGSSPPSIIHQTTGSEQALPAVDLGSLRCDQLRAYQIVGWHLGEDLGSLRSDQLRAYRIRSLTGT